MRSLRITSLALLLSLPFAVACDDEDDGHDHEQDSGTTVDSGTTADSGTVDDEDAGETPDSHVPEDAGVESLPKGRPADFVQVSADDYDDNLNGLITGSTLARFVSNWTANKPAGVTGDLIILQLQPGGATPVNHVVSNGTNVFTYAVSTADLVQVRFTGLSNVEAIVPEGARIDAFLHRYGIDPTKDLVVFAFEQVTGTTNSIVHSLGRGWLNLRYWGATREHLAILNGSINWNATNDGLVIGTGALDVPPEDGTVSVRDLRVDNSAFLISAGELIDVLRESPNAQHELEDVRIVDARGGAEAWGLPKSTNTGKIDCTSYTGTTPNGRCSPAFEGRIAGARSVPWTTFLDTADGGFRFFPKATLRTLFDDLADAEDGLTYIQYCRTNMRSQVTGIIATLILGYPTRYYDTSFIEWSHLAHGPTARTQILPENSPFRTDLPGLTEHNEALSGYVPGGATNGVIVPGAWVSGPAYNLDADISVTPIEITANATTTGQIGIDDRNYKLIPPWTP